MPLIERENPVYPRLSLLAATLQPAGRAEEPDKMILQRHAADLIKEIFGLEVNGEPDLPSSLKL